MILLHSNLNTRGTRRGTTAVEPTITQSGALYLAQNKQPTNRIMRFDWMRYTDGKPSRRLRGIIGKRRIRFSVQKAKGH